MMGQRKNRDEREAQSKLQSEQIGQEYIFSSTAGDKIKPRLRRLLGFDICIMSFPRGCRVCSWGQIGANALSTMCDQSKPVACHRLDLA